MPENLNQNKGIESWRDTEEPETKGRDRIWVQFQRTRNKTKGSNLGAMQKNPNQNEGIESGRETREPEIKKKGIESGRNSREPESK